MSLLSPSVEKADTDLFGPAGLAVSRGDFPPNPCNDLLARSLRLVSSGRSALYDFPTLGLRCSHPGPRLCRLCWQSPSSESSTLGGSHQVSSPAMGASRV